MGKASDVALAESSLQPSGREGVQQEHGPTGPLLFYLHALPHTSGGHCRFMKSVPCQVSFQSNVLCSLPKKSESVTESQCVTLVNHPGGRQWSKPLIPEMCFNTQSSKMTEGGEGRLSNPHLAEDGTSRLVSCRQCFVRVHASK